MANANNPLAERVKKMAVIIEAAKEVGKELEKEEPKEGQGETDQSDRES